MKAFKTTYKDQYKQATNIKPGTYMFQARVYFESTSSAGKYSISLKDEQGIVYNINLNWQVEPNKWCEVSQQIEIEKKIVEFSLMSSELSPGEIIHIGLPQHEEGTNKSTPRANPLDDTEEMKNEVDLAKSYFASEFAVLEDRITLKVGQYRVGGKNFLRNFDGRFGTDYWGEGVELVDENGDSIPVHILSVTAPNPISVYANSTPEVPEMIKLVLDSGSSVNVPVDWGEIDTSVVGEQSIQGIYELPEGVTGDTPNVFLIVYVTYTTVVSVTPIAQVTVDQYSVASLPTTIELNLNDKTSIDAPVTWDGYNTDTAGTFEITAIYDLPSGIAGYKPTVKMTLVVNAVAETGAFIDVKPFLLNATTIMGAPSEWTAGSDNSGNYVMASGNPSYITPLKTHIKSTSVVYLKIYSLEPKRLIYKYVNNNPVEEDNIDVFSYQEIAPRGTIESILFHTAGGVKIYKFEIRNDGSIPPWI